MSLFRVFHPEMDETEVLVLNDQESNHLIRVRRAQIGDKVEIIAGGGAHASSTLIEIQKRTAVLKIESIHREPSDPWHFTLAQSLPKGKTMDSVIQRVTELGVNRLAPLRSENSEVQLDSERSDQKRAKWKTVSIESAKQCGNPWLPEIDEIASLEGFLKNHHQAGENPLSLVAALTPATLSVADALKPWHRSQSICLLIGPEGDFSPKEYEMIFDYGFQPITLGPRVLRVETAACSGCAIILDRLRNIANPDG